MIGMVTANKAFNFENASMEFNFNVTRHYDKANFFSN